MVEKLPLFIYKNPEGKYAGKICCKVNLLDCRPMIKEDEKDACVDFEEGLFSWILGNKIPLFPINQKGQQGFFYVEDNLIIPIDQNK
mgnify:CR=1 FL=1